MQQQAVFECAWRVVRRVPPWSCGDVVAVVDPWCVGVACVHKGSVVVDVYVSIDNKRAKDVVVEARGVARPVLCIETPVVVALSCG